MSMSTFWIEARRGAWLALTVALAAAPLPLVAQQPVEREAKASARTYRVQMRRGDTVTVLQADDRARLILQIDSLQRELEERGLSPEDRARLARHISSVVGSLELFKRPGIELETAISRELSSAMANSSRAAARASGMAFGSFRELVPKGWIGINAEGPHLREIRGDSAYIRYLRYPEVVSVDPDSPAQRAGITRGDVLVAYNGSDVRRREINLMQLLRPSQRITITVRRDGDERIYPLTVSTAPATLQRRRADPSFGLEGEPRVELRRHEMGGGAQPSPRLYGPRGDSGMTFGPEPRLFIFHALDGATPVFGARFVSIGKDNEELGNVFGVKAGVLVTKVAEGPANAAGLRGGDVIVRAAGRDLSSVAQLFELVEARSDDRAVELEVVRRGKPLKLALRW
jgi:membrane-associated protease RseP (regulator of RpoE activity)